MSVYQRLGVRPVINAWGTHSYLGGSRPHPEVIAAMAEATQSFVNTYELQRAAGDRIAKLTKNEAAFVTAGAAAGLLLAAAATMAGTDANKRSQLPDASGMRNEAIVLSGNRNPYHICVKPAGMRVRWAGDDRPTKDQLAAAIDNNTGCCLYFVDMEVEMAGKQLPLRDVVDVCKPLNIPVIVDAAAQIPPFENTWRFTRDDGADLAVFSGGKGLRGPQTSGMLVGTREMIEKVMFFCPPIPSVARAAKASRELIVGLLVAVEKTASSSSAALMQEYEKRIDYIYESLRTEPGFLVDKHFITDKKPFHHLRITIDEAVTSISGKELARLLDDGDPRISVGEPSFNAPWIDAPEGTIIISGETLGPGEEYVVVGRILELVRSRTRQEKPVEGHPARWNGSTR